MKISVITLIVLASLLIGCVANGQAHALYREPFRPQYHYSPPCRWMNDPNGLVYFNGEYHLFYQFHPQGLTWGPMHWGHAVSPDLVRWETLPIALYPDSIGAIWSGGAVIDAENTAGFGKNAMVAIYSYQSQDQGIAYSTDQGRMWTKYDGNPVIKAQAKDFRDPKVFWHEPTRQWVMVLAAGHEVQIYTSPNLREWAYRSRFVGGQTLPIWEVPDLFPLQIEGQTKWVMLVSLGSLGPAGGNGIQYFIGDFDGQTFTADVPNQVLWLDYGPDNYAGTTWNNAPDDKRLYIGWMNNWTYGERIPTAPWRGATTLPRELRLVRTADGLRLAQAPVAALAGLRQPVGVWENLELSGETVLDKVQGRTLEIIAEFEPKSAVRFGIDVHRGESGRTRIIYNAEQSLLLISRPANTAEGQIPNFFGAFSAPLSLSDGKLKLHMFVDESSVEVFADDGLIAMTSQSFVDPGNTGVALFGDEGAGTRVSRLEIYALDGIWGNNPDKPLQSGDFRFCQ